MAPEHGTTHRLHPASLPLELARRIGSLGLYVIGAIVLAARSEEIAFLFLLALPVLGAVVRYATFRYELTDDRLIVRSGLFVKQVRQIPYARIQNLDTTENLLHRLLRVVVVRVQTAGGKEPEAVFQVISRAQLEELRAALFEARAHAAPTASAWGSDAVVAPSPEDARASGADAPYDEGSARESGSHGTASAATARAAGTQASAKPVFRMRAADIAIYGLSSQKGLLVVGGLLYAVREFGSRGRLEELVESGVEKLPIEASTVGPWTWVAVGLGFLILLQLGTLAWAAVTLGDFTLERRGDALHTTYGLFTRHESSLPRARIQTLHVKQGLFKRLFGRVSLHAVSAGGVGGEEKEHAHAWLVPTCRVEDVAPILADVQPETDFDAISWSAVHPKARRRIAILGTAQYTFVFGAAALIAWATDAAPLAPMLGGALFLALVVGIVRSRFVYAGIGFARTEKALYLRRGVWTKRRSCVRYEKIQSVRVTQSPLDRLARHAHVAIDTAGPGGSNASFVVPYLGVRDARRLTRELAHEANRRDFRW